MSDTGEHVTDDWNERPSPEQYRNAALGMWEGEDEVDVCGDSGGDSKVFRAEGGAWVEAYVWVSDEAAGEIG